LIGGGWYVENLLPELNQPGEFWYNHTSHQLYVYPNSTEGDNSWTNSLRFALLENVIELRNVSNVEIIGIGFRDSAATFMSDWSSPSGGDWSLHRGGTIFLENTTDIIIRDSLFKRLDSNAIFLSRRNRNVLIQKNQFEWLAENAIATWGDTEKHDATKGDQPWNTMIHDNVMRELGIYEKQSSGVGHNKAALSDIRNNIMFNMPRAGSKSSRNSSVRTPPCQFFVSHACCLHPCLLCCRQSTSMTWLVEVTQWNAICFSTLVGNPEIMVCICSSCKAPCVHHGFVPLKFYFHERRSHQFLGSTSLLDQAPRRQDT
jgi:hypothetical protein